MASIASAVSPMIIAKSGKLNRNKNNPVILTTWNYPKANQAAIEVLNKNGIAMDAAEAGCRVMESDEENLYIGIGSLPDEDGKVTLDSCVMDSQGNCGSVAFLQDIVHPVSVARKVMEETRHVMLVGEGARKFAISKGFKQKNLLTSKSGKAYRDWLKNKKVKTPHEPHDTISMLVQDSSGDIAGACTSGGWAYKMHGRVGDSPIIGAGLFVDNEIVSAAATGTGEEVIKTTGSFLVVELIRQGYSPKIACEEALKRVIKAHNGKPDFQIGYIALRKDGEIGSAALKTGFDYVLSKNGENTLHPVEGMVK